MVTYLYRTLDVDDELDPLDHGAVRAESVEAAVEMVAQRFAEELGFEEELIVRFYPIIVPERGLCESAGDFVDLLIKEETHDA
jgi:hypothetical protein